MEDNRDRHMNSLNAVKYASDDPDVIAGFTIVERILHDLYNRIEELEKRLGDT